MTAPLPSRIVDLILRGAGRLSARGAWLPLLLLRWNVGLVFATSGWGKIHHLDKVTAFFTDLHIPMPHAQAILVANTELVGGALVLVGLATRFVAVPLACTMIVALLTALRPDIHGLTDLANKSETTYLISFLVMAVLGPGAVSLDALVARHFGASAQAGAESPAAR